MSKYKKASTLQQRFGFLDNDLKTKTHDDIMIWLDSEIRKKDGSDVMKWLPLNHPDDFNIEDYKTVDIVWEHVLKSGYKNSYTIGFIDMMLVLDRYNVLDCSYFYFEVKTRIDSIGELLRQVNMYRSNSGHKDYSFNKWYVVSPDDRFKDVLFSQGIGFIKYTGEINEN